MDSDSVNLGSNPSSPATDFIEEIAKSGTRKIQKNRNGTRTSDAHNPAQSPVDFFTRYERWILPEPNSGCWIWTGTAIPKGYGWVRQRRQMFYVHRLAYEAVHGVGTADGLMVRHKCDVPSCVNPDHLLLGTNLDNMRDMRHRGRSNRGERSGSHKLTDRQIEEIRHLLATSAMPQREIGALYGVTQSAISLIKSGFRRGPEDGRTTMSDIMSMRRVFEARIKKGNLNDDAKRAAAFLSAGLSNLQQHPDIAIVRKIVAENIARFERAMANDH